MRLKLQLCAASAVMAMTVLTGGANAAMAPDDSNSTHGQVHRPRDPYTDGGRSEQPIGLAAVNTDCLRLGANSRSLGSRPSPL